jgi:hypothetical protein
MRFEVTTAFVIGLLLPVLETCRRGISAWSTDFTTMFTDYFAGALLLIGAWGTYKGCRWGGLFLVGAWAWVTGMMSDSLFYQVEETLRTGGTEPNNLLVVIVKFLLWATSLLSLVLSFKTALTR